MFNCVCPLPLCWFCADLVCKINSCCCRPVPAVVSHLHECDAEYLQHLQLNSTTFFFRTSLNLLTKNLLLLPHLIVLCVFFLSFFLSLSLFRVHKIARPLKMKTALCFCRALSCVFFILHSRAWKPLGQTTWWVTHRRANTVWGSNPGPTPKMDYPMTSLNGSVVNMHLQLRDLQCAFLTRCIARRFE